MRLPSSGWGYELAEMPVGVEGVRCRGYLTSLLSLDYATCERGAA